MDHVPRLIHQCVRRRERGSTETLIDDLLRRLPLDQRQAWKDYVVVDGTPVADYFFSDHHDAEFRDLVHDFPNVAPPWPECWIEFRMPEHITLAGVGARWTGPRRIAVSIAADTFADPGEDVAVEHLLKQVRQARMADLPLAVQEILLKVEAGSEDTIWPAIHAYIEDTKLSASGTAHIHTMVRLYLLRRLMEIEGVDAVTPRLREFYRQMTAHQEQLSAIRWVCEASIILSGEGPLARVVYLVNHDGVIVRTSDANPFMEWSIYDKFTGLPRVPRSSEAQRQEMVDSVVDVGRVVLRPAFLALSFLHCANVSLLPVSMPPPHRRKRSVRNAGSIPQLKRYTLEIKPMTRVLDQAGAAGGSLRTALHICRGHFKDYREGPGLGRGHAHGLWWWESHLRGTIAAGEVDKRYRVQAPRLEQR